MKYMLERANEIGRPLHLSSFTEIERAARDGRLGQPTGRRGQPFLLYRLSTWMLFPTDETARFALGANDAAFLLADGRVIAEDPYGSPGADWRLGELVEIPAGLHHVELVLASRAPPRVSLGRLAPDTEEPVPLPADRFFSSTRITDARFERLDETLSPDFAATPEPPYGFRDSPHVFTPVRFHNRSVNRLVSFTSTRWRFDDGTTAEGDAVYHIFVDARRPRVMLEVRDELGFVASIEREVDVGSRVPTRYPFHAVLEGLPAVVFPRDRLHPRLVARGEGPPGAQFVVEWTLQRRRGETLSSSFSFSSEDVSTPMFIGPFPAGAADRLRWRIRHEGVDLQSETIYFGPAIPEKLSVKADAMYEPEGERRVFVAEERPRRSPPPRLTLDDVFGRIVCVDDTLAPRGAYPAGGERDWHHRLGRLLDGPDRPEVRLIHPPPSHLFPEAWSPLLKLTVSPKAVMRHPTLILVSVGLGDLLAGVDPETFERHAAALTDRLLPVAPVVWLTPPPLPDFNGPARAYAAAIERIARARGLAVGDLYTSFVGAGASQVPERFFRRGTVYLTLEGRDLAAETAARALLRAAGEEPR
jgi:hypothetical protein